LIVQLEEEKKNVEDELKEKTNELALQLASGGDQPHSKVCQHSLYQCPVNFN